MAIEMEARQQAPAAAINALAIRCAQLEARCAESERLAGSAQAALDVVLVDHFPRVMVTIDGPVG